MIWYVISIIALAATVALLVWTRVREGRFLKKTASEAMRETILDELKEEDREIYERREKFKKALDEAKGAS